MDDVKAVDWVGHLVCQGERMAPLKNAACLALEETWDGDVRVEEVVEE